MCDSVYMINADRVIVLLAYSLLTNEDVTRVKAVEAILAPSGFCMIHRG